VDGEEAFRWLCRQLEAATPLDELETRGTVRLVLRHLGLASNSVGVEGLSLLLERVMPEELRLRGVEDGHALCERLNRELLARFGEGGEGGGTGGGFEARSPSEPG